MSRHLRILAVCSFNRVRSVAVAAHLHEQLQRRGIDAHVVGTGFGPPGEPPLPEVVDALGMAGLDVAHWLSRTVDLLTVNEADLIVAAERLHVVRLCEDRPGVFSRAFTLPELVMLGERAGPRAGAAMEDWLAEVGAPRTAAGYLSSDAAEIADPTGLSELAVAASIADIGDWCTRLAKLL